MAKKGKYRVLLAQFPLETHSRGLLTVAGMLRDAGMEVIIMGNALPDQVIATAVQEDADVVGISTYCGGEVAQGGELMKAAESRGIKDRAVFLLGGIFPPKDTPLLKQIGFTETFPPSATKEEIVSCIERAVAAKKK